MSLRERVKLAMNNLYESRKKVQDESNLEHIARVRAAQKVLDSLNETATEIELKWIWFE